MRAFCRAKPRRKAEFTSAAQVKKIVISTAKNGEYTFNLKASNGEIILSASETYTTEDACRSGVESMRKNSTSHVEDQIVDGFEELTHPKFEVYQDKAGEYRFRLKARNGQNIGRSEGYKARASCLNGIDSVGRNAPEATVVVEE